MEFYTRDNSDNTSIAIDDQAKGTFLEMARWTKFLSVLGLVFLILMVVGGVIMCLMISRLGGNQFGILGYFGGIGVMLLYVLIAAIFFYPVYSLLKYSTGIKTAIQTNNKQLFNESLMHLKNTFKYYGIMSIIMLGLYGIIVAFSLSRVF